MTDDEMLLWQRQSARLAEVETWLALLVAAIEYPSGYGLSPGEPLTLHLDGDYVGRLRGMLREGKLGVSIDYDVQRDRHSIAIL